MPGGSPNLDLYFHRIESGASRGGTAIILTWFRWLRDNVSWSFYGFLLAAVAPARSFLPVRILFRPNREFRRRVVDVSLLALIFAGISQPVAARAALQDGTAWSTCERESDLGERAQCTHVDMPLRTRDPDGETISLLVMRIVPTGTARRQLWFLDGGPGDAGTASLPRLEGMLADSNLVLYTFDNRGVGGSALLECPAEQAPDSPEGREIVAEEWDACIAHIRGSRTDLDALTINETVHDLARLIEAHRVPGVPVFVMGASYGTFVAQRYLHHYPSQPDGVIIDGIVPPDWGFDEFDAGLDLTGRRLLRACGADDDCAAHLGDDPEAFAEALYEKQEAGYCFPLTLEPEITRLVLGVGLMVRRVPRAYLPVILYRLDRCEWHDQMAMMHLFRNVFDKISEPGSHSQVLQRHIALSELWGEDAPGAAELDSALGGYVMTTEVSASFARTVERWPVYTRPPEAGLFPAYDRPLLMMHGTRDPTVPVERLEQVQSVYAGDVQYFVLVPDAGHVVLKESDCTRSIYREFLVAPTSQPDTSCLADVATLDLAGSAEASEKLFGTSDTWGDNVSGVSTFLFGMTYRYPAIVIALLIPVLCVARARRYRANERGRAYALPPVRFAVSIILWLALSLALWQGGVFLPFLLPYDAVYTIAIVLVLISLQALAGLKLGAWVGRA